MAQNTTPPDIGLIQSEKFDIRLVDNNTGQIPGVPENPREISIVEYKKLKASLTKNKAFTAANELKLYPYEGRWVAIGGNMRLRAMKELGWKTVIGKPIPADTPKDQLRRWAIIDNAHFAKWDFDALANEFEIEDIADACINIPYVDADDLIASTKGDSHGDGRMRHFHFSTKQQEDMKRILKKAKQHMPKDIAARTGNANSNTNALITIIGQWQPKR